MPVGVTVTPTPCHRRHRGAGIPCHIERTFRPVLSSHRRFRSPSDVIAHLWRCHRQLERGLNTKCSLLHRGDAPSDRPRPCPRPLPTLSTQLQIHVHPPCIAEGRAPTGARKVYLARYTLSGSPAQADPHEVYPAGSSHRHLLPSTLFHVVVAARRGVPCPEIEFLRAPPPERLRRSSLGCTMGEAQRPVQPPLRIASYERHYEKEQKTTKARRERSRGRGQGDRRMSRARRRGAGAARTRAAHPRAARRARLLPPGGVTARRRPRRATPRQPGRGLRTICGGCRLPLPRRFQLAPRRSPHLVATCP